MPPTSSRPKLRRTLLVLSALLVAGIAAATITGASSSDVAEAADDEALTGAPQIVTQTWTADGVVTTTTSEPECLGGYIGEIAPTWDDVGFPQGGAEDVVATGPRTVYATGQVEYGGSHDVHLVKYVDGMRRWERFYDGPAHGYDSATAVAARGGAIYTAGYRTTKHGDYDLLLIRWDSAGNRIWTRAYDSGDRLADEAVDVAVDGDGNVVVVGVGDRWATAGDWVAISYRRDGTRRWVRRYDDPSHLDDRPAKLLIDSNDRIYVAGHRDSAGNGYDALLVKYSQAGTRLWAKRYDGTGDAYDMAFSLRPRPGGGVYVCGYTTSVATGVDGLLLAYTSAGSRLFVAAETGHSLDGQVQEFYDLEVMPGGDIICGGYDYLTSSEDRFYVRYSPSGERLARGWAFTEWSEHIAILAKDGQGGVYLSGTWGSAGGMQVFTQRVRDGGTDWSSFWPAAPTPSILEPLAIAVSGVNAYVVGQSYGSSGYSGFVLGHVY